MRPDKIRAGHQTIHFTPYNGTSQVWSVRNALDSMRILRLKFRVLD